MPTDSPALQNPVPEAARQAVLGADDAPDLQAVLWDMDGTLVDTEPYWIKAEKDLVLAHGGSWDDSQAKALVGQALEYGAGVLQGAGVRLSVREIIDTLIGQVAGQVAGHIPWRPGARELLADLQANGIPCAMVTMSETLLARAVNDQLPEDSFKFLVTGDLVSRGKPDPEAYHQAFERMALLVPGLERSGVVAIEDSVPGVTAAQASGVHTLAVPHFVPVPDDEGRVIWPTLAGRGTADLRLLVKERSQTAAGSRS